MTDLATAIALKEQRFRSEPMLYVMRYCNLETASIMAAIKQGIETLDAFLKAEKQPVPRDIIVIYRNRQSETITVEIAYPVATNVAQRAAGEIKSGKTPGDTTITTMPQHGLAGLLAAHQALGDRATSKGGTPAPLFWQRYSGGEEQLLAFWPNVPVHMPIGEHQ